MSTPLAAVCDIKIVNGEKYYQPIAITDSGGAPLNITPGSAKGRIVNASGETILDLPNIPNDTTSGILLPQAGIFVINIILADVRTKFEDNNTYNYDVVLDFLDFPELNPHKPLRGNLVRLAGAYLT